MALRWDLKPAFPKAKPDTEMSYWTRRSVIGSALALTVFACAANWNLPVWQLALIGIGLVIAFDSGDTRQPFEDDESETADATKPEWLYDENDDLRAR